MGDTTFLDAARADHTDQPAEVATRLEGGLGHIASGDDVAPYATFVVHVFGEHLGEWERGAQLLTRIASLPQAQGSDTAKGSVRRGMAALRYAGGDKTSIEGLDAADTAQVMCVICTTHTARHETGAGIEALHRALENATRVPLPEKHAAIRSLAVAGNNLSAELEEKDRLTDAEREAMLLAAETGLKYWKLAGTWMHEERAEYQLARCLLRAGRPDRARERILRCIEICRANDADAIERFFGSAVLALAEKAVGDENAFRAAREAAMAAYAAVPEDERRWCKRELGEIG